MDHKEILEKIELIDAFLKSIGFKKAIDLKKTWDLDSYYKYEPIQNNYIINYNGEDRVLLSINVYIIGGVHFIMSGKMGVSVFETIGTDYDFKLKYNEGWFFKYELRNWKINEFLTKSH